MSAYCSLAEFIAGMCSYLTGPLRMPIMLWMFFKAPAEAPQISNNENDLKCINKHQFGDCGDFLHHPEQLL